MARRLSAPVPQLQRKIYFFDGIKHPVYTDPLGVGMTETPVGWALRNDLVRQIAARTCNCDDARDLLHTAYPERVRYRAQTPVVNVAAFPARTAIHANIHNHTPEDETALRAGPIADSANAIAFEAVNEIWETVGAPSRELPTGEIRRSPGVKGVRFIEIN